MNCHDCGSPVEVLPPGREDDICYRCKKCGAVGRYLGDDGEGMTGLEAFEIEVNTMMRRLAGMKKVIAVIKHLGAGDEHPSAKAINGAMKINLWLQWLEHQMFEFYAKERGHLGEQCPLTLIDVKERLKDILAKPDTE